MNRSLTKIYQLMDFFVSNFGYTNLYIKDLMKPGQVFLINLDHPDYQLIRIANSSIYYMEQDRDNITNFINAYSERININRPRFLDIHITNETVNGDECFDCATIDTNFHSGEDLEAIYPGIYNVVHEVENQESELRTLVNKINTTMHKKQREIANGKVMTNLKGSSIIITTIICVVSCLFYAASAFMSRKYSMSASIIFLGGNYKMFTLGLKEFHRLLIGPFLHGSFIHLMCNVISLYNLGMVVERLLGKTKYILLFLCGILISSLTAGILGGNILNVGISGGVYAIFAYFIMYFVQNKMISIQRLLPTIFINLTLNFLPNVSWQGHLGGAVCGILFYYVYKENKIDFKTLPVIILLIIGLFVKYVKDDNLWPYYAATDLEVVKIARDFGFNNYADKTTQKLFEIYEREMSKW